MELSDSLGNFIEKRGTFTCVEVDSVDRLLAILDLNFIFLHDFVLQVRQDSFCLVRCNLK